MTHYRLQHIDLSMRMELAYQMLDPNREWGRVSKMAEEYAVSRKFLYGLQGKVQLVALDILSPQQPGPKPKSEELEVDQDMIRRAILTLATAIPGSVRGIQTAMELLLNTHRSVGFISQTLQELGRSARDYLTEIKLPIKVLGEADEIFQGRKPCLTVVDGRSFLVLRLSPEEHRDGDTWGLTFLELQEQGVHFLDLASDAARGIRAGVEAAELAIPLRPDLFHLIRDAQAINRSLESRAYKAIEAVERAHKVTFEANSSQKRRGRPMKSELSLTEALQQEEQAISHYDNCIWLLAEIRQALEPFSPHGEWLPTASVLETLQTASELLLSLEVPRITAFVQKKLWPRLEELLAPLVWLEEHLTPLRRHLVDSSEAFLVWAWRHQPALDLDDILSAFPERLHTAVRAYWEILALFHRSSSLAESLHSWLRPYLQAHRGSPDWLLPLLQLFWNHHVFQRGKRKGSSPLAIAGVENVPILSELFDLLCKPKVTLQVMT